MWFKFLFLNTPSFLQRTSHSTGAPLVKGGWSLSWGQLWPMAPRNSLSSIFRPPTSLLTDYQLWEFMIPTKTMRRISRRLWRRSLTTFRFWPQGLLWSHWDMPGNLSTGSWTCFANRITNGCWLFYFCEVEGRRVKNRDKEECRVRMLPQKINLKTRTIRPKEQTNRKVEILE